MSKLGQYIKKKREEKNMALRPFAEMCDLSHAYIDKLEKGVDPRTGKPVIPTIDTLQKISQALNCPLEELLKQGGYIEKKDEVESELDLTLEEQQLLEKIKSDPELSILFHDLKSAPKKKIKQLLKTWEFVKEQFDNWDDEE